MHILVVEDEKKLAHLLRRVLQEESHTVNLAYDGLSGLELAESGTYDAVVLDVMLPELDGFEICRRMRTDNVMSPVLMLTARGSVEDRVAGLNVGADDYLPKPFAMEELLARVNALLRRRDRTFEVATQLRADDLILDLVRHEARRGERVIELTAKEFALLEYLMRHPGQALTRTQITDAVWRYDLEALSNVVDIYIHYLRDKIDQGFTRPLIKTVRGIGYKLEAYPPRKEQAV
ncbi:response regulator transcription factor [Ktedonobacter racemifer]|uniref:Two component transcriptional regulator, winged helix family n=1 Tax=Ktedonobacter racemifer DSM 44963 TaxID=485913 RepID=D6U4A7_KTERA|nr:response regulator transcription factor [Ktedonobacter racemifer]EFH81337.1 two component transcriptional regulator, winged helix family [Ktedonobacter racemifer DSM 44963]